MVTSRLARFTLVCLVLFCIAAVSASAASIKIYTTAASDGTVSHVQATHGDGTSQDYYLNTTTSTPSRAAVDNSTWYECGSNSRREYTFAVFQFPLASLAGTTLLPHSVKLHYYNQLTSGTDTTTELMGFNFDGGSSINGYDNGALHGKLSSCRASGTYRVAYTPVSATSMWRDVDITADLQRQINAGYSWAGYFFSMDPNANGGQGYHETAFSTYESTTYRPYLEAVVPEPSSLLALGGGLIGLLGLVRRKR